MQKKRISANDILNKLHRGFVYTCIGVTLAGTVVLVMRGYNYFAVVRPAREKAELQKIQHGRALEDKAKDLQC